MAKSVNQTGSLKHYLMLCEPNIQAQINCILNLFINVGLHNGNYENLPVKLSHNWICGVDVYQLIANINRVRREFGDVDTLTVDEVENILLSRADNEEE